MKRTLCNAMFMNLLAGVLCMAFGAWALNTEMDKGAGISEKAQPEKAPETVQEEWIDDPSVVPAPKEEEFESGERYRYLADFNGDGIEDMALSEDTKRFGTGGGGYTLYLGNGQGKFKHVGEFMANYCGLAIERGEKCRIWYYWHMSQRSGDIGYYELTDTGLVQSKEIEIKIGLDGTSIGNAISAAIFENSDVTITAQRSETVDGKVTWKTINVNQGKDKK